MSVKILVTGASGGLGRLVVKKLLKRGAEVVITSRDIEKARALEFFEKVSFVPYDISMPTGEDLFLRFGKPDALIHLAWDRLNDYKNPVHLEKILQEHEKFISNLVQHGLKDITGVGTCYEYGLKEGILRETDEPKPTMAYPKAKNLLREYIERMSDEYAISFKWLRVFYVFGEVVGRRNLYTMLLEAVKRGDETFNMSGGEQVRDFLSPEEIAEIIVKAALQKKVEGVINCCSGKPVKLKDFVSDFLEQNKFKIKLNLGHYPYPDYEPMETWGSTEKLKRVLNQ